MYSRFCSRLSSTKASSTTFRPPTIANRSSWEKTGTRPFLAKFSASAETPTTSRSPSSRGPLQHPEVTDVEHVEGAEGDDGATH